MLMAIAPVAWIAPLDGTPVVATPLLAQATPARDRAEEPWRLIQPPQSSLVFARDGSLIGEIGAEWRTSVSIRSLPRYVPQAFVAVEDQRFYQHEGVDVVGIAGAIKDAIGGRTRGASTITQQLVGNMHPDIVDRRDKSINRKLREQRAAIEMEQRYSKEQILEAYLNQISFGRGWFGIEAASRHYFGKSAARLTLVEAATLAAVPKGPALYDPISHPARVLARRNLVLDLMAQQEFIGPEAAEAAKRAPVITVPDAGMSAAAPYLVDIVRRQAERAGVSLMNGGYRVHTTVDSRFQRAAAEALREGLTRVENRQGYPHVPYAKRSRGSTDYLQGMVVALDPRNGDVLALVGGRDYQESQFNRAAIATRQPGSAIKPLLYAAAISDSIPANEIIPDTAVALTLDNCRVYRPENADGEYLGAITLREALTRSRNAVAVQLGQIVGIDSLAALSRRLGIETGMASYPSSAIGASEVRAIELVASYSAFADMGAVVQPRFIRRIDDLAGRTVHSPPTRAPEQAMDPRVAFIVRDMMRDVVERGTATTVRQFVPERVPVAGKTGTTNDNTDVWFVGLTPDVVAGVWLGFDKPKPIARGAAGGTLAAPIWGRMVGQWYEGREAGSWHVPDGLLTAELDRVTGALATPDTPPERRYTEYFLPGTEPGASILSPWNVFMWGPVGR